MTRGQFAREHGWELLLAALGILAVIASTVISPYYLSASQMLLSLRPVVVAGVVALGMVPIMVVGEIDISLPAMVGLSAVTLAQFSAHGLSVALAVPVVLAFDLAAAVGNGLLVTRLRLPSLAVTLGSSAVIGALALLVGGANGYAGFDETYTWLGGTLVGNTIPVELIILLALVVGFTILMHRTVIGRLWYTVGSNPVAARFSGIDTTRIKVVAFAVGGLMSALGGWLFVGQYGSAQPDSASGILLPVITTVVLGGVAIEGGRGTIPGVVLSLFLLGTLQNGMGLANIPAENQTVAFGMLLVLAVLASHAIERIRIARRAIPPPRQVPGTSTEGRSSAYTSADG